MKATFRNFNGMDNMYLDVESMSSEVAFTSKQRDEEGVFFVTIYSDGLAEYGYIEDCDPLHGNKPYVWSSRPEVINEVFNLNNTSLQLAKYSIGVRDDEYCYIDRGILLSEALRIAANNAESLHYGYDEFERNNK